MSDLVVIGLGGLVGGFVNGLAGFGTGLFALGFWLNVLPPTQAVALTVIVAAVTGLQGLWLVRQDILAQKRRLFRFLIPALVGMPVGLAFLRYVEPDALQVLIAMFLLSYGVFFLVRRRLAAFSRPTPGWDMAIGAGSGILGGFAGLSGAILVIWCALRPWTKRETRAVLQPFNFTFLAIMATIFALRGVYDAELLPKLGVAILCSVLAAQAGIFTFRRLTDVQFRWLIIALMTVSGATLLWRTLV